MTMSSGGGDPKAIHYKEQLAKPEAEGAGQTGDGAFGNTKRQSVQRWGRGRGAATVKRKVGLSYIILTQETRRSHWRTRQLFAL